MVGKKHKADRKPPQKRIRWLTFQRSDGNGNTNQIIKRKGVSPELQEILDLREGLRKEPDPKSPGEDIYRGFKENS